MAKQWCNRCQDYTDFIKIYPSANHFIVYCVICYYPYY
jgi:hypothetical protein